MDQLGTCEEQKSAVLSVAIKQAAGNQVPRQRSTSPWCWKVVDKVWVRVTGRVSDLK